MDGADRIGSTIAASLRARGIGERRPGDGVDDPADDLLRIAASHGRTVYLRKDADRAEPT